MTEIINEYITMRNNRTIDVSWFLKFFIEKKRINPGANTVTQFLQFANHEEIFYKLDKEFNLCTLHDKSGHFVKCYPESK